MKQARAKPIGPYTVFAAAASCRGQGGLKMSILTSWLDMSQPSLVLVASHTILLVSLYTIVGHMQVVVAHALDSSYPKCEIMNWWAKLKDAIKASFTKRSRDPLVY